MKLYQNHNKKLKSEAHNMYTEKFNKITSSTNDAKRLDF